MAMAEITTLHPATSKSHSLRTTVPIGIARQFNLEEGDKLRWEIRSQDDQLVIIVNPEKKKKGTKR